MRQPEFQQRMSREKWLFFCGLLAIAVGLLIVLCVLGVIDAKRRQDMLVGIMTTMFIVSGVELIPDMWRRFSDRTERGKFRELFGEAACKEEVKLVFSDRNLKDESKNPFVIYHSTQPVNGHIPAPEGIVGWLAFQDVQAAVHVTNVLSKFINYNIKTIHDRDVERDEKEFCIISFGLGFNDFTHHVMDYFSPPIYKIEMGYSTKNPNLLTDNFTIGGEEVPAILDHDIALVARIAPPPLLGKPSRACFICAGRTAAGTAAAGYFLAKRWKDIHDLYRRSDKSFDRDSVAMVIKHKEFRRGGLAAVESTAAFYTRPDGSKLLSWGVADGFDDIAPVPLNP